MEEGIDNGLHSPRNVGADEESSDAGVQGLSEAVSVVIRVRPTSHSEVGHKKVGTGQARPFNRLVTVNSISPSQPLK